MNLVKVTLKIALFTALGFLAVLLYSAEVAPVTIANYVRAESDHMFRANMNAFKLSFNEFFHSSAVSTKMMEKQCMP